jgi:hypothetical protein
MCGLHLFLEENAELPDSVVRDVDHMIFKVTTTAIQVNRPGG